MVGKRKESAIPLSTRAATSSPSDLVVQGRSREGPNKKSATVLVQKKSRMSTKWLYFLSRRQGSQASRMVEMGRITWIRLSIPGEREKEAWRWLLRKKVKKQVVARLEN